MGSSFSCEKRQKDDTGSSWRLIRRAVKLDLPVFVHVVKLLAMSEFTGCTGQEFGGKVQKLFEEDGGVFLKLAQHLAERPDLIPNSDVRQELRNLQPCYPFMNSKDLEEQLNSFQMQDVDRDNMDKNPFAPASIGQVHVLNAHHVLKLVNLGQERKVKSQEALVKALAAVKFQLSGKASRIAGAVETVFAQVMHEFNLKAEADNTRAGQHMLSSIVDDASHFRDDVGIKQPISWLRLVKVPELHICESSFMVMDSIFSGTEGIVEEKFNDFLSNPSIPLKTKEDVAATVFEVWGRMLLLCGRFHSDPDGHIYVRYCKHAQDDSDADSTEGDYAGISSKGLGKGVSTAFGEEFGKRHERRFGHAEVQVQAIYVIGWGRVCILPPQQLVILKELIKASTVELRMLTAMGLHFESRHTAEDKRNFARLLFSSAAHSKLQQQTGSFDLATPSELPPWTVQILHVLSVLGSYSRLLEAAGSSNEWFQTEKLWKQVLMAEDRHHSVSSDDLRAAAQHTNIGRANSDKCRMEVFYDREAHCIGQNYRVKVVVTNQKEQEIPAGMLSLQSDGYHQRSSMHMPAVPPLSKVGEWLEVAVTRGSRAKDMCEKFVIEYAGLQFTFATNMSKFIGDICKRSPIGCSRTFNVMLFGMFGRGKSSFVNSCHTLCYDPEQATSNFAIAGSGQHHVTKKMQCYNLPCTCITMTDVWGYDGRNYADNTLSLMIEGALPNGWEMGEICGSRTNLLQQGENTKVNRRIHAVILIVRYKDDVDEMFRVQEKVSQAEQLSAPEMETQKQLKSLQQQFLKFRDAELDPVVVVTGMDEYFSTQSWTFEDTRVPKVKREVASICLVNENDVFLKQNYVFRSDRDPFLDKQTLMILSAVVAKASVFEKKHATQPASYSWVPTS